DVRASPRGGEAGRGRLVAPARVGREAGAERERGPARRGGRHAGSPTPVDPGLASARLTPGHTDPGGESGVTGSQVLARPRGECRPLGTDFHAHLPRAPLDLVVLEHVEIDHHTHDAGTE